MKKSDRFNAILGGFPPYFFLFFVFPYVCNEHKVSVVVNASLEMLSPSTHTHSKGNIKLY